MPVLATPDSLESRNLVIKLSPQHLFVNTVQLEFEKRLNKNSKHSLVFSSRYTYGSADYVNTLNGRTDEIDSQTKVNGYGVALQHRIYLIDKIPRIPYGMYVAYGVEYHNFQINFVRDGYGKEVDEDGLEYYNYRQRPYRNVINRFGILGMGGLQFPLIHDNILADLSLGIGYRRSENTTNFGESFFNEGPSDFGYTGTYVLINFKVGYAF
jgi:hypothetical protein